MSRRGGGCRGWDRPVPNLAAELPPGCIAVAIQVHLQDWVLAAGTEVPELVNARGVVEIPVGVIQVNVPSTVDSGVAGRRFQLGRGLAFSACGLSVPDTGLLAGGLSIPESS
jgi:hypothetical protein